MDWVRFLDENQIHYVTRGPNTKKGEVSIRCPMCGEDDPSEHLGINLKSGKWGCHRDPSHRGNAPRTLIKALLFCTSNSAQDIYKQYSRPDPDDLDSALAALQGEPDGDLVEQVKKQKAGPEFDDFRLIKPRGVTEKFFRYLESRGFENVQDLIQKYNLRCALTGKYQNRVILPVSLNDELLGWTSRAIGEVKNAPRYLASSEDVKTTVFNYDELKKGGERLFIVEGPFDALKMDYLMETNKRAISEGYRSENCVFTSFRVTCTFGTSPTISQIALLRNLVKSYDEAFVLFDHGAEEPARNLAEWSGAKVAHVPHHIEDPGEFAIAEIIMGCDYAFNGYFQQTGYVTHILELMFPNKSENRRWGRRYTYNYP